MCNLSVLYIVYIDLNTVYDGDNLTISLRFLSTLQQYDSSLFFRCKGVDSYQASCDGEKKKKKGTSKCRLLDCLSVSYSSVQPSLCLVI